VVTRSVRRNERTNERGGLTVQKHDAFAYTVGWRRHNNKINIILGDSTDGNTKTDSLGFRTVQSYRSVRYLRQPYA